MRSNKIFVIVVIYLAAVSTLPPVKTKPSFFSFLNKLKPGYSDCRSRSCPPWKCQDDSAVIHGYCCGCPGSEYDNVPVPCYPDLKCPTSPKPLCTDYDFMMDCCCTGP